MAAVAMKLGDTQVPTGPPTQEKPVPAWVPVVDHVLDRLPALAATVMPAVVAKVKRSGPSGHIAAQWVVLGALTIAFALHVLGDGSLRSKVDRTECHVEWLVERAVAEDRGEPPPPFSPLSCSR
jgi:hypothetical protein